MQHLSHLFIVLFSLLLLTNADSGLPTNGHTPAEKEKIARTIFDRLVEARGDQRMPKPQFVFSQIKDKGAKASGNVITLEEAAYDVCASLGKHAETALAGLLAHEVIHYYEKHEWEEGFISLVDGADRNQSRGLSRAVKEDVEAFKKDEIEADYMGGFLAYMAGYPISNIMPEVLDGIYAAYNLPDTLLKYPPLEERKTIAAETGQELNQLIDVFEMGNLLTVLKAYDEAAAYYRFLLEKFQSREIYNNAGVTFTLAAMKYFKKETIKYVYPIELDLNSRLQTQSRGIESEKVLREDLLQEAIIHFEQAAHLDKKYPTALLNLACAHTLMGQSMSETPANADLELAADHYLEAALHARKTIRLADKLGDAYTAANAHVLLGILAELQGKTADIADHFKKGSQSELSQINQTILTQGALPEKTAESSESNGLSLEIREQINGLSLDEFRNSSPDWDTDLMVADGRNRIKIQAKKKDMQNSKILLHTLGRRGNTLLIHRTGDAFTGKTAWDLTLGASREDIESAYKTPDYYVPIAGGLMLVYEAEDIIFQLEGGVLKRWYVFLREQ